MVASAGMEIACVPLDSLVFSVRLSWNHALMAAVRMVFAMNGASNAIAMTVGVDLTVQSRAAHLIVIHPTESATMEFAFVHPTTVATTARLRIAPTVAVVTVSATLIHIRATVNLAGLVTIAV